MKSKTFWLLLAASGLILVAIVIGIAWRGRAGTLGTAERLELLRLKSVALGHIENSDYAKAIPDLERIARQLPRDPLGSRNLAIAHFAPNDQGQSGSKGSPEAVAALMRSVEQMLSLEPDNPTAHMLAGRVFRDQADKARGNPQLMKQHLERAQAEFRQAAERNPADPAPHFDLYLIETDFVDPDRLSRAGMDALVAAARRAPNNLRAQLELAYRQAEAELPETLGTLEKVVNLMPPGNQAAQAEVAEALAVLKANPGKAPPEVAQRLFAARNLLQQDPTFNEGLRELMPHPLAFVLEDFRPEFYSDLPADADSAIKVAFAPKPLNVTGPGPIGAIALGDLDGTGKRRAWIVVYPGKEKTRVVTRDEAGKDLTPPIDLEGIYRGAVLADLDLDIKPVKETNLPADLDLLLFGPSGLRLFELREVDGKLAWNDRTTDAKLPMLGEVRWLDVADVDHDGNLDIVLGTSDGTRILRNSGDWVLEDITDRTPGLGSLTSIHGAFGDFDRDGDLDVYLASPDKGLALLENLRGGRFKMVQAAGFKPTSLLVLDANNDGRLDLLVTETSGAKLLLGGQDGRPHENPNPIPVPSSASGVRAGAVDYDNDGWQDVWLLTNDPAAPLRLYRNLQGKELGDASDLVRALQGPAASVEVLDHDEDGDLDLLVAGPAQVQLLENEGGNHNRWLKIRLRAMLNRDATAAGRAARVNYYGIGSTLEARAGRHHALQQVRGTETHFGLGDRRQAEVARIVWTNGVPQVIIRPQVNATVTEEQRPKGSCPFLYAWDGQRFVFVTDCLWSSALGMKLAHDVEMGHERQLNHLVIPGKVLVPRGGRYSLQFTNELWEAPYLDEVELWCIDHPKGVELYTNQRIPPVADGDLRLVLTANRYMPRAAHDHQGRDVLQQVARKDGVFVGGFERRRYVGLAEPHYLELDLGDLSGARSAALVLTGWIWPTDTSGNVAISRDPRFKGTSGGVGGVQPPALLAPDGSGSWKIIQPMMGFPCGKLQPLLVPLPLDQFSPGDYRVRIATSMEIYWDEAFVTTDLPSAEVGKLKVVRLKPVFADLHYRGFGQPYQESPFGPQLFAYEDVDRRPIWLPMPGPFTRYGTVREVLEMADDRYVVMSPGDELSLEFEALPPADPDRQRTFIFYASGWLKDFDMNGVSGEAAAPLPFAAMSKYPYAPPEVHPDPSFLREYMTRSAQLEAFWDALRPAAGSPQNWSAR